MSASDVIKSYYAAFNDRNWDVMLSAVHDDVIHFPNQGEMRKGKSELRSFVERSAHAYDELLSNLVIFQSDHETRYAAEFTVNGRYLTSEPGFPEANGQPYALLAGAFFEIVDEQIKRITTYYNLKDWLDQISGH